MSGINDALELPEDINLPQPVVAQLNQRLLWIAKRLSDLATAEAAAATGISAASLILVGTKAQRTALQSNQAGRQALGTEFYETDTSLTYIARYMPGSEVLLSWYYLAGNQRGTYANKPASLSVKDAGLLYTVTDKNRTLRWTGSAWEFAAWETIPVGYISGFTADPGTGWHICDGAAGVSQLNADGTTSSITVENFSTARYPKWGPTAAGAGAAVAPAISGSTGPGTAHTHGITVTVGAIAATATAGVAIGTGTVTGAALTHTHPAPTATGGAANESAHTHPVGSLVNDALGEPLHYGLQAFQRI